MRTIGIFISFLFVSTMAFAAPLTQNKVIKYDSAYKTADSIITDTGTAVGIGSGAPRAKLDVDGAIYGTTFYGSAAGLTNLPASMVYPGAGIPLSTGSSWDTSITNNSANWNTAYGWGNHASAGYLTAVASDSNWTVHGSYPAGCSAGQFVTAIGDTLTCNTPSGSGDVLGPATNNDAYIPVWSGANSKTLANGYVTDATGDCGASAICMGGHTHSGYLTAEADTLDTVLARGAATSRAVTIGTTTAGTVNKVTITAPASGSTLTIADGKTLTVTNTVNLNTMTDGKWCKYTASGTVLNCDQDQPTGTAHGWTTDSSTKTTTTYNVGIGSATPRSVFDVVGNGYLSGTVTIGTGSVTNNITVSGNVGVNSASPQARMTIDGGIYQSNANALFGLNSGNVGIGSGVPQQKLEVDGSIYIHTNVGIGTASPQGQLHVYGSGNVGLGTSAPAYKLDVNGTVRATSFFSGNVGIGTSGSTSCTIKRIEGGIITSATCS